MARLFRPLFSASLALAAPAGLCAQDLLGVTWNGALLLIDSHTAAVYPLGTGFPGQNALTRDASGTFWSTRRLSPSTHFFTNVDPATGTATTSWFGFDTRGLADGPGTTLYAIQFGGPSQLVQFDGATGVSTAIGPTGFFGIQGLTHHQGVLYAWDVFDGLLVVDPATGAATDPFPGVGGPAYQQSLCSHPDGRLLLGGGDSNGPDQLFEVDPTTGGVTLIGTMPIAYDVRGIEPLGGFATPFGQGCAGAAGPVSLTITGLMQPGGSVTTRSGNHAPNAVGFVVFGFSNTTFAGQNLPYLLDPQFGTANCSVYCSIDVPLTVTTAAASPATMQHVLPLPPAAAGLVFHVQHACVEPVPGGMSWSNAATVHVR